MKYIYKFLFWIFSDLMSQVWFICIPQCRRPIRIYLWKYSVRVNIFSKIVFHADFKSEIRTSKKSCAFLYGHIYNFVSRFWFNQHIFFFENPFTKTHYIQIKINMGRWHCGIQMNQTWDSINWKLSKIRIYIYTLS